MWALALASHAIQRPKLIIFSKHRSKHFDEEAIRK